jgi:hypothetical protein
MQSEKATKFSCFETHLYDADGWMDGFGFGWVDA